MARAGLIRLFVVTLLLSCMPTEPCACPPARTWFLMFGEVVRADGSAVPVGRVRFSATDAVAGSSVCDASARDDYLDPPEITATDGRFRATLFSMGAPGPRCVRVVAFAAAAGSDSAVIDGLIVRFRGDERLDSLGVRLTIP